VVLTLGKLWLAWQPWMDDQVQCARARIRVLSLWCAKLLEYIVRCWLTHI